MRHEIPPGEGHCHAGRQLLCLLRPKTYLRVAPLAPVVGIFGAEKGCHAGDSKAENDGALFSHARSDSMAIEYGCSRIAINSPASFAAV